MCTCDIVSSFFIALNVLPMPADVHEIYPFKGKALGNSWTCEIQGFFIATAQFLSIGLNCVLSFFYVCKIRYGISDEALKKRMLPFAMIFFSLLSLPMGFLPLVFDLFNPQTFEVYCLIGAYPENCNNREDMTCIRGGDMSQETEDMVFLVIFMLTMAAFSTVLISLGLVVASVFKAELTVKRLRRGERQEDEVSEQDMIDNSGDERSTRGKITRNKKKEFEATRAAGRTAMMYIAAFALCWSWTSISIIGINVSDYSWRIIGYFRILFTPLHGFLYALIFVREKVHSLRRMSSHEDMSFFEALKKVIVSPGKVPPASRIVSALEMVDVDIAQREDFNFRWRDYASRDTPTMDMVQVLSVTGMRQADFEKEEPNPGDAPATKREFYKYHQGVVFDKGRPKNSSTFSRTDDITNNKNKQVEEDSSSESVSPAPLRRTLDISIDSSSSGRSPFTRSSLFSGYSSLWNPIGSLDSREQEANEEGRVNSEDEVE